MTTPEQQAMQLAAQAWREPAKSDLEMDVTRATVIAEKFATIIAEREALKAGQERDRMRLVACEMVALADTPTSAATAREMHPDYKSDACETVARRVDECIKLRAELQALRGSAEPYCYVYEWDTEFGLVRRTRPANVEGRTFDRFVPLYTRPAVPLTDEQIEEIGKNILDQGFHKWEGLQPSVYTFARAIEAHIKGAKT